MSGLSTVRLPGKVGVKDAVLYLRHRVHSHLDKGSGTVRILFLDFSGAFNTIQPLALQEKLLQMRVDPGLVAWISSYLIDRPQFIRLKDITSDTVVSSIGAPQGLCCLLSSSLCTPRTSDTTPNCVTSRSSQTTQPLWGVSETTKRRSTGAW